MLWATVKGIARDGRAWILWVSLAAGVGLAVAEGLAVYTAERNPRVPAPTIERAVVRSRASEAARLLDRAPGLSLFELTPSAASPLATAPPTRWSPLQIINWLLPLLGMMLGAVAVSGDQGRQRLRLLVASGHSPVAVTLAIFGGALLVTQVGTVAGALFGAAAAMAWTQVIVTLPLFDVVAVGGATALVACVSVAFGMAAGFVAIDSGAAEVAVVFAWVVGCLVLPTLPPVTAEALAGMDRSQVLQENRRMLRAELLYVRIDEDQLLRGDRSAAGIARARERARHLQAKLLRRQQAFEERSFRWFEDARSAARSRARIEQRLSWFSPFSITRELLATAAGSGAARQEVRLARIDRAFERFRSARQEAIADGAIGRPSLGGSLSVGGEVLSIESGLRYSAPLQPGAIDTDLDDRTDWPTAAGLVSYVGLIVAGVLGILARTSATAL